MKKRLTVLLLIVLIIINLYQFILYNYSKPLYRDAVPNEEVASQIAEIVLVSVYGDDVLLNKPFEVIYDKKKKVWTVYNSLPNGYLGWGTNVIIRKKDAKVMNIILE